MIPVTRVKLNIWTVSESSAGVLCACLPSLAPLFIIIFKQSLQVFSNSSATTTQGQRSRAPRQWPTRGIAEYDEIQGLAAIEESKYVASSASQFRQLLPASGKRKEFDVQETELQELSVPKSQSAV